MGALQTDKQAFKELTPYLMYCILIMSSGMMIYGMYVALDWVVKMIANEQGCSVILAVSNLTSLA